MADARHITHSHKFHPGQFVVCVDDAPVTTAIMDGLRRGHVYTVRWAGTGTDVDGSKFAGIRVEEIVRPSRDGSDDTPYSQRRFRPLDDDRLDVFRKALVGKREVV